MMMGFFDQFASPLLLGIPLALLALSLPWLVFPKPTSRWINNDLMTIQKWSISGFTQQIFIPLSRFGHKWAVLLVSLMIYILTLNTLGLLPYTFTPTTQLSVNLAIATPLWLATVIIGLRTQPSLAMAHFLPIGTPIQLIPILVLIETVSLIIRPLALGVRLTANLTAGHLLIQLISTATSVLLMYMPTVAILTGSLLSLLSLLEIAVALIQAYVFILLISLYLEENT